MIRKWAAWGVLIIYLVRLPLGMWVILKTVYNSK